MQRFKAALPTGNWPDNPESLVRDKDGDYVLYKDVERKIVLLKAAYDLLKKCDEGPYVKNATTETVFYDGVDCDGYCLMEDIGSELGIEV